MGRSVGDLVIGGGYGISLAAMTVPTIRSRS